MYSAHKTGRIKKSRELNPFQENILSYFIIFKINLVNNKIIL